MLRLEGKRVLITGAGTGIGRGIALKMAGLGAVVMVTDLDEETAAETCRMLETPAGQHHGCCKLDVTNGEEVKAGVARTVNELGGIDLLVNNAGVSTMQYVESMTEEEWDYNFDVNIKGVFRMTRECIPHLKESKGRIINLSSMAAVKAAPLLAHYTASKFAVTGFTKACALELAPYGINVNCICPGYVKTSMQEREVVWEAALRGMTTDAVLDEYVANTPLGRLCLPEDVARVAVFLASEDADYLTGEDVPVAGGGHCK